MSHLAIKIGGAFCFLSCVYCCCKECSSQEEPRRGRAGRLDDAATRNRRLLEEDAVFSKRERRNNSFIGRVKAYWDAGSGSSDSDESGSEEKTSAKQVCFGSSNQETQIPSEILPDEQLNPLAAPISVSMKRDHPLGNELSLNG